jgi:hypothetical protein
MWPLSPDKLTDWRTDTLTNCVVSFRLCVVAACAAIPPPANSTCSPVDGDVLIADFPNDETTIDDPIYADQIYLTPYTAYGTGDAYYMAILLDDNSGNKKAGVKKSGPFAYRLAVYNLTTPQSPTHNATFTLLTQTVQGTLTSPNKGVYNLSLPTPFHVQTGTTLYLAEWFNATVLQPFASSSSSYVSVSGRYNTAGFPSTTVAPQGSFTDHNGNGYGNGVGPSAGGNYDAPIELLACGPTPPPIIRQSHATHTHNTHTHTHTLHYTHNTHPRHMRQSRTRASDER